MKYNCPYCAATQSSPNGYLLHNDITCPACHRIFRLADADHRPNEPKSFIGMFFRSIDEFITPLARIGDGTGCSGAVTQCCWCHSTIPIGPMRPNGSIPVTDYCSGCGRKLPGPYKEVVKAQQTVIVPDAPKPATVVAVPVAPVKPATVVAEPPDPLLNLVAEKVHYKKIYNKAVELNGGQDLTDQQFQDLLKRLNNATLAEKSH